MKYGKWYLQNYKAINITLLLITLAMVINFITTHVILYFGRCSGKD